MKFCTDSEENFFLKDLDSHTISKIFSHWGKGFKEQLMKLIERSGKSNSQISKDGNITKKVLSDIRMYDSKKIYRPTKNTLMGLIIALELPPVEALDLMARARYMLSDGDEFDLIVGKAICARNYNVEAINEILSERKLDLIGYMSNEDRKESVGKNS